MKMVHQPILATIRGTATATGIDGRNTKTLTLEHEDGTLEAMLCPVTQPATYFPDGLEVVVSLHWTQGTDGENTLNIGAIEPARLSQWAPRILPGGVDNLPSWLLEAAPDANDVRCLWVWLSMISTRPLQEFGFRVFHDPSIGIPFVIGKASREHHHAYPGGLLRHSLEAATHIPYLASPMEVVEWEIACIAALFHDIGKILFHFETGKRSDEEILSRHEDATLEILSPHLSWLRSRHPDLTAMLKHHLCNGGREYRPLMPGAMLPAAMDRLSAACDARQKTFEDRPAWHSYGTLKAKGPANRFYRPAKQKSCIKSGIEKLRELI